MRLQLRRGFVVDGLDLAIQVLDQELGEATDMQIERDVSEHHLEIAGLVAQAIDDGAPEMTAEFGSAEAGGVHQPGEAFQLVPRLPGRESVRQIGPIEHATDRAHPFEIGVGSVDALQDGAEVGQHVAARPQR